MTDDPKAPWGGFKLSGVGREYGRTGIEVISRTEGNPRVTVSSAPERIEQIEQGDRR
jgi:hypothetical protein